MCKPKKPDWLKGEGAKHWTKLLEDLEFAGILAESDGEQIAVACSWFVKWQEAEAEVQRFGAYHISEKTGYQVTQACYNDALNCQKNYQNALTKLGLNPVGRKGVKASASGAKQSNFGRKAPKPDNIATPRFGTGGK